MASIYDHPRLYDLAFSFRDIRHEVDVLQRVIAGYSKAPVMRVFEMACGNCPHALELVRRGYEYVGLDLSPAMLAFSREKVKAREDKIELLRGDMTDFALGRPVDFAYVMLGSLYATSTAQLASHFDCVGRALVPGGLYFMDWCVDFDPYADVAETWDIVHEGTKLQVTCMMRKLNRVEQTYEEIVIMEFDEGGQHRTIKGSSTKRAIYPQEFLAFVEARSDFEFVGWWNQWDLERPLDGSEPTNRPITVIRRTVY